MIARHIHHALAQVHELQQKVLEKQRFKGYSGRARAMGGTVALLAAVLMGSDFYPQTNISHFLGWGAVFAVAIFLNYGALVYWFFFDSSVKRDLRRLRPILDLFPPLFVGGILTVVFAYHRQFEYLIGIWMCLFGLANLATRHVVPPRICLLGILYIASGTVYLFLPNMQFINPWPMGIAFFVGEWLGGFILHFDGRSGAPLEDFFKIKKEESNDDEE